MGMLVFLAGAAVTVWMETAPSFTHAPFRAHVILAAVILVPCAVAWTLIQRRAEKRKTASAPRSGYSPYRQGPRG